MLPNGSISDEGEYSQSTFYGNDEVLTCAAVHISLPLLLSLPIRGA